MFNKRYREHAHTKDWRAAKKAPIRWLRPITKETPVDIIIDVLDKHKKIKSIKKKVKDDLVYRVEYEDGSYSIVINYTVNFAGGQLWEITSFNRDRELHNLTEEIPALVKCVFLADKQLEGDYGVEAKINDTNYAIQFVETISYREGWLHSTTENVYKRAKNLGLNGVWQCEKDNKRGRYYRGYYVFGEAELPRDTWVGDLVEYDGLLCICAGVDGEVYKLYNDNNTWYVTIK